MMLQIHDNIKEKLAYFLKSGKIPNIIFHGPSGSGKRMIVNEFVDNIYNNDKDMVKSYVMNVNCAHGKGIRFVREELKFFAKTHINVHGSGHFKTIIMSNADKLTIDAQSALRRCIELFSHTTRFFIIVEDKYKLLKPILSRFCEIFVCEPIIDGRKTNLHQHALSECFSVPTGENAKRLQSLKRHLNNSDLTSYDSLIALSTKLYEKGYSGLDIMTHVEKMPLESERKWLLLLAFHKVKREFRNEKLLMLFMLNFIFIRSEDDLENISFM